jgi:hypothetical protein
MKLDESIKVVSDLAKPYRITEGDTFRLKDIDPDDTAWMEAEDKLRAKEGLQSDVQALAALQDMCRRRPSNMWPVAGCSSGCPPITRRCSSKPAWEHDHPTR